MYKRSKRQWLASVTAMTMATAAVIPVSATTFKDIANYPYKESLIELSNQGIISGYADGTYQPNRALTRGNVVKILGKYLVSLGYSIPSDYKRLMRFSDLNAQMDDELLQYAALVADYKIFNGAQGKLNYEQVLTRKQMALVIVRALSAIDQFEYEEYVSGQRYMQEFLDITEADEEGQRAINVLDYYDVTTDEYFHPQLRATRGDFAHHLYSMLEIESPARNHERPIVRHINVVTDQRLDVVLSDGTRHHVQLDKALEPNIQTDVTFKINGLPYTGKVEYVVRPITVTHVENINGAQFVVHFNQPIELPTTYKESDLKKIVSLTNIDRYTWLNSDYTYFSSSVPLKKGELSEDGRSYTITTAMPAPLDTRYNLKIAGIYAQNGTAMPTYEDIVYFEPDTGAPEVLSVEATSANEVKVVFSEPVNNYQNYNYSSSWGYYYPYTWYADLQNLIFEDANGNPVSNVGVYIDQQLMQQYQSYTGINATEIVFDLSQARTNGGMIAAGEDVYVTFNNLLDVAGNGASELPLKIKLTKGQRNGIAPTAQSIKQTGAKQFEISFNEELAYLSQYALEIVSDSTDYYVQTIEKVNDDTNTYIVTVDDFLRGQVTIRTAKEQYVTDVTGEVGTFTKKHTFTYDATPAKVVQTDVVRINNLEYLYVKFDRHIVFSNRAKAKISGTYTENRRSYMIEGTPIDVQLVYREPDTVKIPLYGLLKSNDIAGMTYDVALSFEHIENEYKVAVEPANIKLTRSTDYNMNNDVLEVVAVNTSRSSSTIKNPQQVVIDFNLPVSANAVLKNFYRVTGYDIQSVQINPTNDKQVMLTLNRPFSDHHTTKILIVGKTTVQSSGENAKLSAKNSIEPLINYEGYIYFTENRVPQYQWYPTMTFNHNREIVLSFTEAMATVSGNEFIVEDQYGHSYKASAMNDPKDARNILIRVTEDIPDRVSMTVQLKPNRTLTDVYHNVGTFKGQLSSTYYPK